MGAWLERRRQGQERGVAAAPPRRGGAVRGEERVCRTRLPGSGTMSLAVRSVRAGRFPACPARGPKRGRGSLRAAPPPVGRYWRNAGRVRLWRGLVIPGLQPVTLIALARPGVDQARLSAREREGSGASGLGRFTSGLPDVPSKDLWIGKKLNCSALFCFYILV